MQMGTPMDTNELDQQFSLPANEAWRALFDLLWQRFSPALRADIADAQTTYRDRACAKLDNLLSGSAWELWRRKWKSQGGYPSLTHGGLSLLEIAVPFIELSR